MRDDIQNPAAYEAAIAARIKANRAKTNRRNLVAATANDSREFRLWLGLESFGDRVLNDALTASYNAMQTADLAWTEALEQWRAAGGKNVRELTPDEQTTWDAWQATHRTHAANIDRFDLDADRERRAFEKRYRFCPEFIRDAIRDWGGLTPKQLDAARRSFAKIVERLEGRDAAENARRATAPAWVAGRQRIEGVAQTIRMEQQDAGYDRVTVAYKALLLLADGRKLWTSLPKTLLTIDETTPRDAGPEIFKGRTFAFSVDITPGDDDATMAFGKRPTTPKEKAPRAPRQPRNATNVAQTTEQTGETTIGRETANEAKRRRAKARRDARRAIADAPNAYGYRLD